MQLTLFPAAWLLLLILVLGVVGLVWRQRKTGKIALLLAGLLLLLVSVAYTNGDVSWRLLPTLVTGYHYEPNTEPPDSLLVPRRPELIIERQLAALVRQTGAAPLRADTALSDYEIEAVHIDDWHKYHWLTAVIDTTFTYADGSQEQVPLMLPAKGGSYILVPLFGEVNRNAFTWYAPESSLGHLLTMAAPVTILSDGSPPLTLDKINTIDVSARNIENVNPETSFTSASDISAVGTMLLDVDLRQDQTSDGNAVLLHTTGKTETLVETQVSARAVFAPNGQRLAYIRSPRPLQLVVREANGEEDIITSVDWMTHHWLGDDQIAYSHNSTVYLHDLRSDERRALAEVPSHEFHGQHFRVSPDGEHLAYADLDNRLWVKDLSSGKQQTIGWEVSDVVWGSGLTWRDDGQQLLFTTHNRTTLPDQQELWLWDTVSGETHLLVRDGSGFLGSHAENPVGLSQACWVDEETVLFAANDYRESIHLLAARTDGSGVWDVTPDVAPAYVELHCANGYVAANSQRTAVTLYAITP
jgi:hypothetical protein